MELIADRFVVMRGERAVDLSSGDEIKLTSRLRAVPRSRPAGRFDAIDGRGCTIPRSHASSTTASSARCEGSRPGAAALHGKAVGPPPRRQSVRRPRFCAQTR